MQEKDMVNDVLSSIKSSLTSYASAIAETENQQLRQTLQQMRNSDEQFQYQLYQAATQKGFYKPAPRANPQDIQEIKSQLSS
jgi:spore coat protein CotF